jgi:glycosyltransferase involved in cell wall biosynthesis
LKLLHVLPTLDPRIGGPVESARAIAASMLRLGVSSDVLSLQTPSCEIEREWPVPLHSLGKTFTYYQYSSKLVSWLKSNHRRYDAIVVHGVWRYASVGTWRALRGTSTPYFLFTHGMLDPWFARQYPMKHAKKSLFWLLFEHRVAMDAAGVLFTSEKERDLSCLRFRNYGRREYVVGMGTAPPPPQREAYVTKFVQRFPKICAQRMIVFLGRIHAVKGCDLVIKAFARASRIDPRLHLLMAGPDETGWRADLEKMAGEFGLAERVTWTGNLDSASKWAALTMAEAFILPSHTESYGHAVVEALACGVPVLISNKVHTWPTIAKCDAGFVEKDDLNGATNLFRRWLEANNQRRDSLALNARTCYLQHFELDSFARRLGGILSRAIYGSAHAITAR